MIELGVEYVYETICKDMGWKQTTGEARKRQMDAVRAAYEYFVPVNEKTGKPKRGAYVFTKQIGEVVLEDGRKRNGRKREISEEEFECLFRHMVCYCLNVGDEYNADGKREALVFTSQIYSLFGLNIYKAMSMVKKAKKDTVVWRVFENIVTDAAKANSYTRIAKRLGGKKNSLPKVVTLKDEDTGCRVRADELNDVHDEIFDGILDDFFVDDRDEAIRRGFYRSFERMTEDCMSKLGYESAKLMNVLAVDESDCQRPDPSFVRECQAHFKDVTMKSIASSVGRRVNREKDYGLFLNDYQTGLLSRYHEDFKKAVEALEAGR